MIINISRAGPLAAYSAPSYIDPYHKKGSVSHVSYFFLVIAFTLYLHMYRPLHFLIVRVHTTMKREKFLEQYNIRVYLLSVSGEESEGRCRQRSIICAERRSTYLEKSSRRSTSLRFWPSICSAKSLSNSYKSRYMSEEILKFSRLLIYFEK